MERASRLFDCEFRSETFPMAPDHIRSVLAEYDGFLPTLGDPLGAKAYAGKIACKVMANFGVGYNHIDVDAAKAAGLAVSNTPGAVTDATADIALTLMLMTCRRASEGERVLRSGLWEGWHPTQFLGTHMSGKTLGIVGMGRIGQATARRAHFGFGMEIVYYNRSDIELDFPAKRLPEISDVMGAAEIVSLHIPGGPATRHVISADMIAAMKPTGILVNTARGDIIDEAALITALQSGAIGGAGLDVYEQEPAVPQALIDLDTVTLLPHLGTASLEVRTDMGMMAVDNLEAFFAGRDLPNAV